MGRRDDHRGRARRDRTDRRRRQRPAARLAGGAVAVAGAISAIGDGVEVIALTSVAANLAAIIGGILVFHEPIGSGSGSVEVGARLLAFCLAIAGAALMRATQDAVSTCPHDQPERPGMMPRDAGLLTMGAAGFDPATFRV